MHKKLRLLLALLGAALIAAPVQAHLGDFMIGTPAGLENTQRALDVGITTIGNLGMTDVRFPTPVFHGDTLRMENQVLFINGERIDEPWVQHTDVGGEAFVAGGGEIVRELGSMAGGELAQKCGRSRDHIEDAGVKTQCVLDGVESFENDERGIASCVVIAFLVGHVRTGLL